MLKSEMKLKENIFTKPETAATRDGFGTGLVEAGERDVNVVALSADLTESTRVEAFKKKFPERFVEVGVAEQNLAALASGFAAYGKVPFMTSYASFNPGRNNEQIRTTISLNRANVKVCGMHAGVSVGPDGATHQALEDIALMRVQPNMTVINPCDAEEARKATLAAASLVGPVYLRFGREKAAVMTNTETPFEIGKANVIWEPSSQSFGSSAPKSTVVIFATGSLVYNALSAAKILEGKGIQASVVNIHTIKPLDREAIVREAHAAGAVVTVEEHQIAGGLGSAIAEVLAAECPVPIEFIGMHDEFGQSGTPEELIKYYKMDAVSIAAAAEKVIQRKKV